MIDNAEERLGKKLLDEFGLPGHFVKDAMTLQFVTYEEDAYKGNEALRPHLKLSLDSRFCSILMPDGEGNFRPLCGDHYMTLGCPDQEHNCQRREHAIWRFETGGVCTPSQPSGSNIPQDVYQILSDAYAALCGQSGNLLGNPKDGQEYNCMNVVCKENGLGYKGNPHAEYDTNEMLIYTCGEGEMCGEEHTSGSYHCSDHHFSVHYVEQNYDYDSLSNGEEIQLGTNEFF